MSENGEKQGDSGGISRRKALGALGAAGAATVLFGALSSLANGRSGSTVTEASYGGSESDCCGPCVIATTLAELRNADIPDGDASYYVTDAGREGHFYYDAADTASADNGGTVVVSVSGARFKRIAESGLWNVRWFGAKGDGATNDRDAIHQATQAAKAAGGGTVLFPAGSYALSGGRITIDGANIVWCSPGGSEIVVKNGANNRPIVIRHASDIAIRGISFRNTASLGLYDGVMIQNSSRVTIEACRFYDYTFYGVSVTENTDNTADKTACNDITVTGCHFENIGTYAIEDFPKALSENHAFTDNTFVHCGKRLSSGAAIKAGQATRNALIRGNRIYGGNIAFAIGNWESLVVCDNIVTNNEVYAVAITTSVHPLYTAAFDALTVRNNLFVHTADYVPAASYPALTINGSNASTGQIEFSGNTIHGASSGYLIRGSVSLANIRIADNVWRGVRGSFSADNASGAYPLAMELVGNHFVNEDDTLDIQVQASGQGASVIGNTFVKYGAYSLNVRGEGVTVAGNRFLDCNPKNTANRGPILLSGPGDYTVTDNVTDCPNAAYLMNDNAATSVYERGNRSTSPAAVSLSGSKPAYGPGFVTNGGSRLYYGASAPSGGAYRQGDKMLHTAPVAGGYEGWICVAGGTPGTWKPFGPIEA